jgi:nucleotide-binding universal stress UspA family protein
MPPVPADKTPQGSILVAVDGSTAAQAAGAAAAQIAKGQGQIVRGVYVIPEGLVLDPYTDPTVELGEAVAVTSREELIDHFRRRGDVALAALAKICEQARVPFVAEIIFGRVADLILQQAPAATLLALGRRGNTKATEVGVLGSNFLSIAHHAPCPFVAGGDPPRALRRLLLAYNGSPSARDALAWAIRLQQSLPADVTIVAVQESETSKPDDWIEEARRQVPPPHITRYQFVRREGDPVPAITATARESQADAIVLGRYRHMAAIEWLVGSTVDGVLKQIQLPVLVA